jgi:hypothetical protein
VTIVTEGRPSSEDIEIIGSDDRVGTLPIWSSLMRAVGALVLTVWSVCLFIQPALADKRFPSEANLEADLQSIITAYKALTFRGGLDPSADDATGGDFCTAARF